MIGENSQKILEIGCHTGYFSKLLKNKGHEVIGVEIDKNAAAVASKFISVIIGDVENEEILKQLDKKFDVILLMHILEHLVDPWSFIKKLKKNLAPKGYIIVTIPNIAAWKIRKKLFFKGDFSYEEYGILDRSHLRFFNLKTIKELLVKNGYKIIDFKIVDYSIPFEGKLILLFGENSSLINFYRKIWSQLFPNLVGSIFLFKAIMQNGK